MLGRLNRPILCIGVLCLLTGAANADLVGHWPFDGTVNDVVGTAHGTFNGGQASYQKGKIAQAISFDGVNDYVNIPSPTNPSVYTIAAWVKPARASAAAIITRTDGSGPVTSWSHQLRINTAGQFHHYLWVGAERNISGTTVIVPDTWYHVTIMAQNNGPMRLFVNGKEEGASVDTAGTLWATGDRIYVGSNSGHAMGWFQGLVDDVQIYNEALPDAQIQEIMKGLAPYSALDPVPEDGTMDVPRDVVVSWSAGEYAATHDVYLGTTFADVNDASRATPMSVLASQGQTAAQFDPAGLVYGRTYYWRIDEVNAAPDNTIFKGETWSFTAEPFSYPVTPTAATASSSQTGMGPQNTINRSGLNANDEHSTELTQMWMTSGGQPNWIQYEFDKAYKLDKLLVWNSNQLIESFLGFGAKEVTIEYSTDGAAWTALAGVPEFARASGSPAYTANTTVNFGGVVARFVKLTIAKNWGGVAPQTGLSEVRFLYIPVQAREPQPATGAKGVSIDASLDWRPGREAGSHDVYIGTDQAAVAAGAVAAKNVADHGFDPGILDFGTVYFWKVNEVNATGNYEGEVWSFTTQEYAAMDDFESYNDDDNRVYDSWIDGWVNKTGSQVGYDVSPFAEKTIVHGGKQSMPLKYDNSASPFVSEAERTFESAQNWTVSGADSLVVYFRGAAPGFVETAPGTVIMNAIGTDIWDVADQFRFVYKTLTGNGTMIARVDSLFNSNVWAKGGVMIRQSIEPGSVHAYMSMTPGGGAGGNGASFQRRPAANQASANNDSTTVVAAPYWVKIERKGNDFSGFISPDGVTWTQLGTAQAVPMTGPVLIGLALCSHDAAVATAAEFSNIAFTGALTGDWQVAEIGAVQPAGNSIEGLYLSVKDSAGKAKIVQSPDTSATARTSWQQWKIPLTEFTSAGVKMNAVKTITIGVGSKAAPAKGGAGIVFIDDLGYGRSQ